MTAALYGRPIQYLIIRQTHHVARTERTIKMCSSVVIAVDSRKLGNVIPDNSLLADHNRSNSTNRVSRVSILLAILSCAIIIGALSNCIVHTIAIDLFE